MNGAGPVFLLKDTGQEGLLAFRARLAAFKVEIAEKAFKAGDKDYPAGSWIMADQKGLADAVKRASAELSLDFDSAAATPDVAHHESKVPRLAVWHSWADTEAVGWVRFVLDREKVPYAYIRDEDVRAGRLKDRYDVIIFAHNYLDLQDQILGIDKKLGPMAYKKTKETPNLGVPDASDDITGGIGWVGMAKLEEYLNAGGVLVTLGNGSAIALQGGLVRDVFRRGGSVFTPGSELKVKFTRPDHPLAYGFPEVTSVFRSMLPVYDIDRSERGAVVLQWGTKLRAEDREEEKPDAAKATDAGGGRLRSGRRGHGGASRARRRLRRRKRSRCSSAAPSRARTSSRGARPSSTFRPARVASSPSCSTRSTATSTAPTTASSGTPCSTGLQRLG